MHEIMLSGDDKITLHGAHNWKIEFKMFNQQKARFLRRHNNLMAMRRIIRKSGSPIVIEEECFSSS